MPANQGDIEIRLGDEVETLRCALGPAKEINARFGSFMDATRRVAVFDLDAYIFIVAKGVGKTTTEVGEIVFRAGIKSLVKPINDYVLSLSRGGNPETKDSETATGEG